MKTKFIVLPFLESKVISGLAIMQHFSNVDLTLNEFCVCDDDGFIESFKSAKDAIKFFVRFEKCDANIITYENRFGSLPSHEFLDEILKRLDA